MKTPALVSLFLALTAFVPTEPAKAAALPELITLPEPAALPKQSALPEPATLPEPAPRDTLSPARISALKPGTSPSESPSETIAITFSQAQRHPSPTIADILRAAPGLAKASDGPWSTSINIRGLGENRLVTLIDGNRIETATDLTASLSMLNPGDIDHIEVIKGAQSTLYGSGAIGGIINIVSKDGHFSPTPEFSGSLGTIFASANLSHGEHLTLQGGSKRWYLKTNATYCCAQDIRTPLGLLPNSGYTTTDFGAIAAFKPLPTHTLRAQLQRNASFNVGIPGGASFSTNATASYKDISRTLASLSYTIADLSPALESLRLKAFWQQILRNVEMRPNAPKPQTGASPQLVTPYGQHTTYGLNAESRWMLSGASTLIAGAEIWRRDIASDRKKYIDQYATGQIAAKLIRNETPLPDASYTSAGLFAQNETKLAGGRVILTLGARMDANRAENEECHSVESIENLTTGVLFLNPPGKFVTFEKGRRDGASYSANAGVLFKITAHTDLAANLSRGYRSPQLEELFKFIDLSGNKVHFGNPALKPEKSLAADMGLRYHNPRLTLRLSVYATGIRDMIVERKTNVDPQSVNDTLVLSNASRALLYGADFDFAYRFAPGFELYGAGSWTIGLEMAQTRAYLPLIPPANGHIGLSYDNERILGARLELFAAGRRDSIHIAPGERATDGYARLDFAINSKEFKLGPRARLQLLAGIENLTDAAYVNFLSTNRGAIILEPGRNIWFRANISF